MKYKWNVSNNNLLTFNEKSNIMKKLINEELNELYRRQNRELDRANANINKLSYLNGAIAVLEELKKQIKGVAK